MGSETMDDSDPPTNVHRRRYLRTLAAVGSIGVVAGCTGASDDGTGGGDSGGGDGDPTPEGWNNELEVFHGWAGGDGEEAINALISAFEESYPDMETTFQSVGASANVNLNATVLRRMRNNRPMSSFANWPGLNLERYRNHLMDLTTDVWEREGFLDVMQDRAIELCRFNNQMPAVPIGSHRMNNLFYNIDALEQAGVDPESLDGIDALLDALAAIDDQTDYVPMGQAMKAPWTVLQLWAQVLQSQAGVDAYMAFIEGDGDRQAIVDSLEVVKDIQQNYISSDASTSSFTDMGNRMIGGDIATMHQGNWLAGQFRGDDGFNFQEHWGWIPFPGTEGVYGYHIDAFVAPDSNPSEEETIAWQRFVGTKEAQIAFNNPKGSVPLRTDIDPNELADFIALTYEDLTSSDRYPPTIAHGLAVTPQQMGDCKTAMSNHMMGPYDVEAAADSLLDAVAQ